jgi:hypothetical protein
MERATESGYQTDQDRELERLRARVTELENENAELARRANTAIAAAQERAYWLDRWHLDLNALMRRRGASEFRAAVRAARSVVRLAIRLRRALTRRG